ncbi:MAG TPA: hypothetical protein P5191_13715 [Ruminococcus sp.]|nr:hypothetical protein [Ruminococcus sp.]
MDLKKVYEFSYDYLLKEAKDFLSEDKIEDHVSTPDAKNCDSMIAAYEFLLVILQDFNRYPNVIKYFDRKDEIKRILHNYDLEYIASLTKEELYSTFKSTFGLQTKMMWERYAKGIITGASFMLTFKDYADFKSTFDSFDDNDMTREALALLLSTKIYNMGFALACDWLKELGYYQYAKPDTHTKDICAALNLAADNDDIGCFEAMVKIAKAAEVDAYKVDKVWWLICSGNFYRYNVKLPLAGSPKLKENFIAALKKEFL